MARPTVVLRWASLPDFAGRLGALESGLSADELERARRFRVADARRRFVVGRSLLRRVLGAALGADPRSLVITTDDRGKPELAWPRPAAPPSFNVSHSGDVVVVATAPLTIGVDVEQLRTVANAARLARRFFSDRERETVLAAEGIARDRTFLRIWTQKEAYLKAIGLGVGMPLREIETEPDPTRPPRIVVISGDRRKVAGWSLLAADLPDAVCTVAVRGPRPELEVRRSASDDPPPP